MTVPVPGSLVYTYSADDSTTSFSYPVRFLDKAEIVVILREGVTDTVQVLGSDYTISGSSWPTGGSIVFGTAPASGKTVVIYRNTVAKQLVDLENTQRNDANAVEAQLDRLAMVQQDHGRKFEGTWQTRPGEVPGTIDVIPDGHILVSDEDGNLIDGGIKGSAANSEVGQFATAAQGAAADSAVQPGDAEALPTDGTVGQILVRDPDAAAGRKWSSVAAGVGDMLSTAYDPAGKGEQVLTVTDAPSDPDLSNDTDKLALRGLVLGREANLSDLADTDAGRSNLTLGVPGESRNFWVDVHPDVKIAKMNDRLMIGDAVVNDGNAVPTVKDYAEARVINSTKNSQAASLSTLGLVGFLGASQSSDWLATSGSKGTIGLFGLALNNKGDVSSAWAGYNEGHRFSNNDGNTFALELETIDESTNSANWYPYSIPTGFISVALNIGNGGGSLYENSADATAAITILNNPNKFKSGIVFYKNAITGTDGATGQGSAIRFARGHRIDWFQNNNEQGPSIVSLVSTTANATAINFSDTGFNVTNGGSTATLFQVGAPSGTLVNFIGVTAATTGVLPAIRALGSDTNISGLLIGKGTGGWQFRDGGNAAKIAYNTTGIGFFAATPAAKQAITGALSTVSDAAAKDVLTSILSALTTYGLATNSTT